MNMQLPYPIQQYEPRYRHQVMSNDIPARPSHKPKSNALLNSKASQKRTKSNKDKSKSSRSKIKTKEKDKQTKLPSNGSVLPDFIPIQHVTTTRRPTDYRTARPSYLTDRCRTGVGIMFNPAIGITDF